MKRFAKFLLGVLLLVLLALAIAWFSGGVTHGLLHLAESRFLPYRTGKEFTLTGITHQTPDPLGPVDRVRLAVSRGRVLQTLDDAGGWHRAVPPGLIRDGLTLTGDWTPYSRDQKVGITIPVEVVIQETEGDHPHLTGSLPVAMLNAYMNIEFERDFINEDEEYFLGHYDYTFWPSISEATITTTNSPALDPETFAGRLGLDVFARGSVRLTFEENLFRTSTDAKISDLHLHISAYPYLTDEGVVLNYDAVFHKLRGNVSKLHSYGDKKVSEKLKKKWTRSLNKEKRKKKLARHPFPPWVPLDLMVDLHFYPEHNPLDEPVPR